eukprot:scaffold1322_cov15-Tisochrysis_lutea.AAC.1
MHSQVALHFAAAAGPGNSEQASTQAARSAQVQWVKCKMYLSWKVCLALPRGQASWNPSSQACIEWGSVLHELVLEQSQKQRGYGGKTEPLFSHLA